MIKHQIIIVLAAVVIALWIIFRLRSKGRNYDDGGDDGGDD